MSFKISPLTAVDSYKLSHRTMYPKGVTEVYSNFTPRSVKHLNVPKEYKTNEIIWFGGQAVIEDMIEMWDEEFFGLFPVAHHGNKPELDIVLEKFAKRVAPFAGADFDTSAFKALHELGYLPLEIKTLPEGSHVPVGVPVLTIRNTKPEFFWLTNYLETYLSTELWKMSTSATVASYYRKIIENWAEKTGGNKDFISFQAHDFSMRGMSGSIDAAKSGAGHLLSFNGSDTIPAVDYLAYHYSGDETFVAASVPATEHSIQTAFVENDLQYFTEILDKYPTGIVSVVADGYDYWSVLTNLLPQLKDKIMARLPDAMGFNKLTVRPDSGCPIRIICGYTVEEVDCNVYEDGQVNFTVVETEKIISREEFYGSIQVLWDLFGGTINEKGYKTLDQHIGLIYGDSITLARAEEILKRLEAKGFASDNVVFGVGSYTYQMQTRDTLGFAMKATNIVIDNKEIPLFKDPKTDDGTKKSAKGLLSVTGMVLDNKVTYALINNVSRDIESGDLNCLSTLYKDGLFYKHETLVEIRNRVKGV